jgi:hypothetical protein
VSTWSWSRAWPGVAVIVAATLLGAHVFRSWTVLMDAAPDPLGESAVARLPMGPSGVESTLFVPDCATSLVVRFDPTSTLRGEVTASLSLNQLGGIFPDAPVFQARARLETMSGGVWTLGAPLDYLRGRFVRLRIRLADAAQASVLMRAPRPPGHARVTFDDRWAPRRTPIAGAVSADHDPIRCLATREPMPRWLRLPAMAFLGSVWMLVVGIVAMWLWPTATGWRSDRTGHAHRNSARTWCAYARLLRRRVPSARTTT